MNARHLIGIIILALVWLWLVWAVLRAGVTLMSILTVIMSGIIIFVPLYKKYVNSRK